MANEAARKLRKTMTPQEVRLWSRLRRLRARGFHFRRQVPLDGYIVDFACLPARLVIEVDGSRHAAKPGATHHRERDRYLVRRGFRLLRFWNNDVDQQIDAVMARVCSDLESGS